MSQFKVRACAKVQRQENIYQIGVTGRQEWLESRVLGEEKGMTFKGRVERPLGHEGIVNQMKEWHV